MISDDSDCVVFGASMVYRYFFRSAQTVEVYSQENINKTLKLKQQDLVSLALLLGQIHPAAAAVVAAAAAAAAAAAGCGGWGGGGGGCVAAAYVRV